MQIWMYRPGRGLAIALVIAVGLDGPAGCGGDRAGSPPSTGSAIGAAAGSAAGPSAGSSTGSSAAGAAAQASASVAIAIDGAAAATIAPAQLASWPRLDALVPPEARKLGTWELVALDAGKAAPIEIQHPSANYPDMVPAIFPGDGGAPAFGMFDPVELARRGKPALRQDHITAIRIKLAQGGSRGQNDDSAGGGGDPSKLVLTIKTPTATAELSGPQLIAMAREAMPGNADQKGWQLATLLAAAGVTNYRHLVLRDAAGTNLTLERADLDRNTVAFVKLNRQGALRLRVLKKVGTGWNPAGDLRGLVAIDAN
jgi:hypothetical protein